MPQFTIPASFLIEADSREQAVEAAQSLIDYGLEVSNDDGAVVAGGADTPDSHLSIRSALASAGPVLNAVVLTVEDIQPGCFYRVVETGEADSSLTGAVVLGAAGHLKYAAVTVWDADGAWQGTTWHAQRHADFTDDYVDTDARFVRLQP